MSVDENFRPQRTRAGTLLQSATPKSAGPSLRANGLLLRGVVVASYTQDAPQHPYGPEGALQSGTKAATPVGVYCDVLVYPSIPGERWHGLQNVMVLQEGGTGIHAGRIWIPRATTMDINQELSSKSDPAYVDGDHVLIGFMNDSPEMPIILGSLPHPVLDLGRAQGALGVRMGLKVADGNPDLRRHNGVHWGVDGLGNFLIDTRRGNDGKLESTGQEKLYPTDAAKGNQTLNLPKEAKLQVVIYDMAVPNTPTEIARLSFQKTGFKVTLAEETELLVEGKAATAKLTLGNGAVKAAIAGHLKTLYNSLKSKLDAADAHTHPDPQGGVTGPSSAPVAAPAWDSGIESSKLLFPDG